MGGIHGKVEIRVLMLGPEGVGKTTILYRLKYGDDLPSFVKIEPTAGFNVETIDVGGPLSLTVWDVGPRQQLWHHYFQNTMGLIYVVDSTMTTSVLSSALQMLEEEVLEHPDFPPNAPLLLFVNSKSDGEHGSNANGTTNAVEQQLEAFIDDHSRPMSTREWRVVQTFGQQQHLADGMLWLAEAIARQERRQQSFLKRHCPWCFPVLL
eukprot:TRINITY_DN10795_c0_g1_i1.p1 TRINITY_DN10795_c0_g1~~TRINITY_DN10795_c0_g1_i1.p1  ORF type:complete len:208 (+),score=49.23 TRINITY_DN10795_c0_g1_i1:62-685(+)